MRAGTGSHDSAPFDRDDRMELALRVSASHSRGAAASSPPAPARASTARDPREVRVLPAPPVLFAGASLAAAGAAAALLGAAVRPGTGGMLLTAAAGGAIGALAGAAVLAVDRARGGDVRRGVEQLGSRMAQVGFVVRNLDRPWLARMALAVRGDAVAAQHTRYGRSDPRDGPQDAFRHAYATALFALRMQRDRDVPARDAALLAVAAGSAKEAGDTHNDAHSRAMDLHNNAAGARLAGDGRARAGEAADAGGWVAEAALATRVLEAIAAGALLVVDRSGSVPVVRVSSGIDLPGARSRGR